MDDRVILNIQRELGELHLEINGVSFLSSVRFFFWSYIANPKETVEKYTSVPSSLIRRFLPVISGIVNFPPSEGMKVFIPFPNDRLEHYIQGMDLKDYITDHDLVSSGIGTWVFEPSLFKVWLLIAKVRRLLKKHGVVFDLRANLVFSYYLWGVVKEAFRIENRFRSYNFLSLLVHADNHPNIGLYVSVAKKYGVPSILLQHGYDCEDQILDYLYADYAFLWGQDRKIRYMANGISADRLYVLGRPNYARACMSKIESRSVTRKWLYCSRPHNPMKNYFFSRRVDEGVRILRTLINCRLDEVIYVKLHPAESSEIYECLIREMKAGDYVFLIKDNLESLRSEVDLVISEDSSVAVESCFWSIPLVVAHFTSLKLIVPFGENRFVPVCRNEAELSEALNNYRKFLATRGPQEEYLNFCQSCIEQSFGRIFDSQLGLAVLNEIGYPKAGSV